MLKHFILLIFLFNQEIKAKSNVKILNSHASIGKEFKQTVKLNGDFKTVVWGARNIGYFQKDVKKTGEKFNFEFLSPTRREPIEIYTIQANNCTFQKTVKNDENKYSKELKDFFQVKLKGKLSDPYYALISTRVIGNRETNILLNKYGEVVSMINHDSQSGRKINGDWYFIGDKTLHKKDFLGNNKFSKRIIFDRDEYLINDFFLDGDILYFILYRYDKAIIPFWRLNFPRNYEALIKTWNLVKKLKFQFRNYEIRKINLKTNKTLATWKANKEFPLYNVLFHSFVQSLKDYQSGNKTNLDFLEGDNDFLHINALDKKNKKIVVNIPYVNHVVELDENLKKINTYNLNNFVSWPHNIQYDEKGNIALLDNQIYGNDTVSSIKWFSLEKEAREVRKVIGPVLSKIRGSFKLKDDGSLIAFFPEFKKNHIYKGIKEIIVEYNKNGEEIARMEVSPTDEKGFSNGYRILPLGSIHDEEKISLENIKKCGLSLNSTNR